MMIEVILLEKGKLGNIGDVASVASGFARNYLLPRNKALRATPQNRLIFEAKRESIELEHQRKVSDALQLIEIVKSVGTLKMLRQSSEDGKLYGSVTTRDIALALSQKISHHLDTESIKIHHKIKAIGSYQATFNPYSDLSTDVLLDIIRM